MCDFENSEKTQNTEPPEKLQGSFDPNETKQDALKMFLSARDHWNNKGLDPQCRYQQIPPVHLSEILMVFQSYTLDEIKNAIENFSFHLTSDPAKWKPVPPYGSFFGFLKGGVERYHKDEAVYAQFQINYKPQKQK